MKKQLIKISLVGAAAMTSGCMPMEQAALVYSSKNSVGLNLASGTTENPGFDLIIGVKNVDVAYVPVAVAKHCPDASGSPNCRDRIYSTMPISGGSTDPISSGDKYREVGDINSKLQSNTRQISDNNKKIGNINELENRKVDLERQKSLVASEGIASDEAAGRIAAIQGKIDGINDQLRTLAQSGAQSTIENLQGDNARLLRENDELTGQLSGLNQVLSQNPESQKNDAYSVYGSFNGTGSATTSSGGAGMGKVFSTGIAAQNLSKDIGKAQMVISFAECVKTLSAPGGLTIAQAADKCMIVTPRNGQ